MLDGQLGRISTRFYDFIQGYDVTELYTEFPQKFQCFVCIGFCTEKKRIDRRLVCSMQVSSHQLATSLNLKRCLASVEQTVTSHEERCENNGEGFIANEGKLPRLAESFWSKLSHSLKKLRFHGPQQKLYSQRSYRAWIAVWHSQ